MSILKYNNITLPYASTTNFSQEAVFEESDTDWNLTKYDISVQAVLNSDYINTIAPQLAGVTTNPARLMVLLRKYLLQPRQRLSMTFNGIELIPQIQQGNRGPVDAKNGPQPQSCKILQLNNNTFLLSYRIVAHYWENLDIDRPELDTNFVGCNVIYNRWTETMEIDARNFSRRTREGKYAIRSDNADGFIVDRYRADMAQLAVPEGWLRERSSYIVSKDGLSMSYTVVDVEKFKMPPFPAYQAEGTYTESTTSLGHLRHGKVRIKLRGTNNLLDQRELINLAVSIAANKLIINGAQVTGGQFIWDKKEFSVLEQAYVEVDMYENIVECVMGCWMQAQTTPNGKGRVQGVAGLRFGPMMNWTPLSDGIKPSVNAPDYPTYGNLGPNMGLIFAAAYFDPSLGGGNNDVDERTRQMNLANHREVGTAGRLGGF